MDNYQVFFAISALLLGLVGLFFTLESRRKKEQEENKKELRREEVLAWADECIECLQSLLLLSVLDDPALEPEKHNDIRLSIVFDTSVLIERGRLFFKNEVVDDFGKEKEPAYRGYRPRILDHLVVAHQIARYWPDQSEDDIRQRSVVAEECIKKFVSLAQLEVGRERAASVEATRGGQGVDLRALMAAVANDRAAII